MSDLVVSVRVAHPNDRVSLGTWVDLDDCSDYESFMDKVHSVTGFGPDDDGEIVITDTEAPFPDGVLSFPDLWDRYEALRDSDDWQALAAYLGYHGWDLSVVGEFRDAYEGLWDSLEDHALNYFEDCYPELYKQMAKLDGFTVDVDLVTWETLYFTVDSADGHQEHVFRSV